MNERENIFDKYYHEATSGQSFTREEVRSSGAALFTDLNARAVSLKGSHTVNGNLIAQKLSSAGSLSVKGNLECVEAELAGSATVGGKVACDTLVSAGSLEVSGDIRATHIHIKGSVSSPKLSGATIRISGGGSVDSIEGEDVYVNADKPVITMFGTVRNRNSVFKAVKVKASGSAFLGNCVVESVEAKDVHLAKGCRVGHVVYSATVDVAEGAVCEDPPQKSG